MKMKLQQQFWKIEKEMKEEKKNTIKNSSLKKDPKNVQTL